MVERIKKYMSGEKMNELYNSSLCGIDWLQNAEVGPAKIQHLVGPLYSTA